jgi:beta-mannanase
MLTLATRINNTDTLKMVADGDFDSLLRDHFAVPIAQWGHPMFIRLNWEFNGNWYPWAVGVNGNTAADYVAAWRHVVDLFRANGATNVSWVWCANAWASGYGLSTLAQAYPGDAYVDWTALDGYRHVGSGLTFSQIFGRYYDYITTTLAPTKPIMIAETATVEQITGGLSKAQWIADMFNAIPTRFPKLAALLYFDENYGSEGNYSLDSSPAASQAWRDGIAASAFQANDFTTLNTSPIPPPSP